MSLKDDLYYFAHPLSSKNPDGSINEKGQEENFRLSCIRTAELLKRGYNVFSPIPHSYQISLLHDLGYGWYTLDNLIIAKTDFKGIILAPNWETSAGCVAERKLFLERNLEILLYEDVVKEQLSLPF